MGDSEVPKSITVTREDGKVTISRRSYRSGDFVQILFGFFAGLFGVTFLWISIDAGTLFDGVVSPIVILVLLGYAYFGATRITNRRTVVIADGRISAKDGPLPQFVRSVDTSIPDYGNVTTRSASRFTFPPTHRYALWYVGAKGRVDLFRRLPEENEAKVIQAVVAKAVRGD